MHIYTVHTNPSDNAPIENSIFIKEGFSWFGAIFHVFWTLYHKMWLISLLLLTTEILLSWLQIKEYLPMPLTESLKTGIFLFVGANFNDWHRDTLEKKGYIFQGVALGKNESEARYNYIANISQNNGFVSGNNSHIVI